MQRMKISCPCHFGLESVLSFEIKKLGGQDVQAQDGRVSFWGTWEEVVKANLWLRTAERVQIVLGEFEARSFTELVDQVLNLPLEQFIGKKDAFPVKGHCLNSQLHSVPDCQSIVKKAVVKRLESVYHQSWFEETGSVFQLQFFIRKDRVLLLLDTTGAGLHKRGYRKNANEAPIRETLAAGILDLARVRSDSVVYDPMCGSGTFLIEAALRACNIAPGLNRRFACEKWDCLDGAVWERQRRDALEAVDRTAQFRAYGWDADPECVSLARENAKKAGVSPRIRIEQRDLRDFETPQAGIVLANPPYGERMLQIREAEDLYRLMGEKFREDYKNQYYIISPHEEFEQFFGKKADRRRKLYNGMLKCQLFMYFH